MRPRNRGMIIQVGSALAYRSRCKRHIAARSTRSAASPMCFAASACTTRSPCTSVQETGA